MPGFTRSKSRSVSRSRNVLSRPFFAGKTGVGQHDPFTHAPWIPPSKPSTLLARHVVRKRNFLGAFREAPGTDTTRIHTQTGGIYESREIKRATFLAFYRSSTMAARACPEFSPPNRKSSASVGNRGSCKSTLLSELLFLIYISIFSINNFSTYQILYLCAYLYHQTTRFSYNKIPIYIRNKTNYYFTIIYVISMYTTKSRRNIYELTFRRAFNTKQTIYCTIYTLSIHVQVRVVEASSNRVEPSNASVDIIFHRLERITSLVNYCPYRFGSVGRGRIAEERDDIITIINPECPSLCQGGARGRILSTNGGLIHGFPLLPPVNPSLGTRCTHDAEYPSGRPTLPPGGRGEGEVAARVSRGREGGTNPRTGVRSHRPCQTQGSEQGTIIFGDRA